MPRSYLPRSQAAQVAWAAIVATRIAEDAELGVPATLVSSFTDANSALQTA
jgi:hypothetical protein